MTLETLRALLGWCALINIGILLVWFVFFSLAHDFMYRMHGRLFRISVEKFDELHYLLIAHFNLLAIVFNLVPYLALRLAM